MVIRSLQLSPGSIIAVLSIRDIRTLWRFLVWSVQAWGMTELIRMVEMETRQPVEGILVVNFLLYVIFVELWRPEFAFFWKNDPLRESRNSSGK